MENQTQFQEEVQVEQKSSLQQATPLSKYLAMALFVLLPFLGAWIGYQFAPEEVVEIEKAVEVANMESDSVVEKGVNKSFADDSKQTFAFVSYNEGGWAGAWLMKNEGDQWTQEKQIAGKYIVSDAVLSDSKVYLNVRGKVGSLGDWSKSVAVVDVSTQEISYLEIDELEYVTNLLSVEDTIFVHGVNPGFCVDIPSTRSNNECEGEIYLISKNGTLSKPEQFSGLPGAKELIAYDPSTEVVLLRDGYGDAGCASSHFYAYDLRAKDIVDEKRFSGCASETYPSETSLEVYENELADYKQNVKRDFPHHIYQDTAQSVTFLTNETAESNTETVEIEGVYKITELMVN